MRKHGKVLLAIFGSLLMIVFVLPQFGSNAQDPQNFVRGKLNGKKVLNRDINAHGYAVMVLQNFRTPVTLPNWGTVPIPLIYQYAPFITPNQDLQATHWYLLLKEAETYGIGVTEQEVTTVVSSMNMTEAEFNTAFTALRITPGILRQAIREGLIVNKLQTITMNATQISLPEIEYRANLDLSRIKIAYATLDGTKDWQSAPNPTDEQIKKHFDIYKDTLPTDARTAPKPADPRQPAPAAPVPPTIDGHAYPFGYKHPDRVKIEFLKFDKAQLAKEFKPTSQDLDAAFDYYNKHQSEFKTTPDMKELLGPPTSAASQPATQPVKSWEQVKNELVDKQVDQRAAALLRKIAERAATLANENWKSVTSTAGYRETLPREKWSDYSKIANDIAANKSFLNFKPTPGSTDWQSETQLAEVPDIGKAFQQRANNKIEFPRLAVSVKELTGGTNKDALGALFLQVGPEGPLLTDAAGNFYLYRVVAAEKSHAPASVDEVKNQVIEDLKKLATYEKRKEEAKQLAAQATAGDLVELAKARNIPAAVSAPFNQRASEIPSPAIDTEKAQTIGPVPGLVEAAFTMTKDPAATQPVKDGKRVSATTTFASDATLRVYALELLDYTPTSAAEFAPRRVFLAQQFNGQAHQRFQQEWLSLDAIAARLNYVPEIPFKDTQRDE
jgi:hypothetical protein